MEMIVHNDITNLRRALAADKNVLRVRRYGNETLLMRAVWKYPNISIETLDLLINHTSYLTDVNDEGWDAFHYCCWQEHALPYLQYLLRINTSIINNCDNRGYTPLHVASMFGRIDHVAALLNCENIDVEIKDRFNRTARDRAGRGMNEQNADAIRRMFDNFRNGK